LDSILLSDKHTHTLNHTPYTKLNTDILWDLKIHLCISYHASQIKGGIDDTGEEQHTFDQYLEFLGVS